MNESQVQLTNIVAYGVSKKTKINARLDERIQIVDSEILPAFRLLSAPCGCKQWHEIVNNLWYSCRGLEKCEEHASTEQFAYQLINRIPTILFGVEIDDETGKPKYDRPKKAPECAASDEISEVIQSSTSNKSTESGATPRKKKTVAQDRVKNNNTKPKQETAQPAIKPHDTSKNLVPSAPVVLSSPPVTQCVKKIKSNKVDVNEITHEELLAYVSKESKFHAPTALNKKNDAGEMMFVVRFKVSEDKISEIGDSYIYVYGSPYSKLLAMSRSIAKVFFNKEPAV